MVEGKLQIRVYFEDTDAGGVVYYANYLKFAERGRAELLREKGYSHGESFRETKTGFVVRHCEVDFKSPARLDNLLEVHTKVSEIKNASILFEQKICHEGKTLIELKTAMVHINEDFKPTRIPDEIRNKL